MRPGDPLGSGKGSCSLFYLASGPIPSEAANAVNVACMSAAFQSRGYNVTILAPAARLVDALRRGAPSAPARTDTADVRLERVWFPQTRGGRILYLSALAGKLRFKRPNFVYGRMLEGCRLAARFGIPTAFEAHMPIWEHDSAKERAFKRMIGTPAFCGAVVISHALGRALTDAYPDIADRVFVAHDAADARPCPEFRRGAPTDRFEILYAGSLYPGKGIELLVRLAPRCPWAHFTILGGSEDEVRRWRNSEGVRLANISFLGRRPHAAVAECLTRADVLVAPYQSAVSARGGRRDISRWMSPLKLFEYMAANRPIVASDLPVLREVLAHGRNALLVAPGDVDQWVLVLETLRDDPGLARRLATTARIEFEREHTWAARADRVLNALGWAARGSVAESLPVAR